MEKLKLPKSWIFLNLFFVILHSAIIEFKKVKRKKSNANIETIPRLNICNSFTVKIVGDNIIIPKAPYTRTNREILIGKP